MSGDKFFDFISLQVDYWDSPWQNRHAFLSKISKQNRVFFFLARDRIGIKPLLYYAGPEKFMFVSEIKAIVKDRRHRETDQL